MLNSTLNIPLRGVAIGNGWIDSKAQYLTYIDFATKIGLLQENTDVRTLFLIFNLLTSLFYSGLEKGR